MHQASTAARLCKDNTSPPQAMPAAGVAILKRHFTINQITKKPVALWVFLATAPNEGCDMCYKLLFLCTMCAAAVSTPAVLMRRGGRPKRKRT